MLKRRSTQAYETSSEGGVRNLFGLGPYEFQDTLDGDEVLHHFILEIGQEGDPFIYEIDGPTMYEFMARFLGGEYEMKTYQLERSPGHEALLDVLEMSTARARAGESGFSWEEFDSADTEVMDPDAPEPEGDGPERR